MSVPLRADLYRRVPLVRRHRFIVDRWVWELPGGYVDDGIVFGHHSTG